jgi:hypothetical protein
MNSKWTAHLGKDPIKQEEFRSMINASKVVLDRLVEMLEKEIACSLSEQKKVDHYYDTPNWEYLQVDCNATQRTMQKIINLCKI